MNTIVSEYIFTGFGFNVLLHNIEIKSIHGEEYPEINLNEVKLLTAKQLLVSRERLTGEKLKFLRTFMKVSLSSLGEIISAPASTIRSWEEKNEESTGMSVPQERQFRIYAIEHLLDQEKKHLEKGIIMAEDFDEPVTGATLDLKGTVDLSYLREA